MNKRAERTATVETQNYLSRPSAIGWWWHRLRYADGTPLSWTPAFVDEVPEEWGGGLRCSEHHMRDKGNEHHGWRGEWSGPISEPSVSDSNAAGADQVTPNSFEQAAGLAVEALRKVRTEERLREIAEKWAKICFRSISPESGVSATDVPGETSVPAPPQKEQTTPVLEEKEEPSDYVAHVLQKALAILESENEHTDRELSRSRNAQATASWGGRLSGLSFAIKELKKLLSEPSKDAGGPPLNPNQPSADRDNTISRLVELKDRLVIDCRTNKDEADALSKQVAVMREQFKEIAELEWGAGSVSPLIANIKMQEIARAALSLCPEPEKESLG